MERWGDLSAGMRATLHAIGYVALAFVGPAGLTMFAAPDRPGMAIAVGLGLLFVSALLARGLIDWIILPFAVLSAVGRWLLRRPRPEAPGEDRWNRRARSAYTTLFVIANLIVGTVLGALPGGWGVIRSSLAFAICAALLCRLLPSELLWGLDPVADSVAPAQSRRDGPPPPPR